jgi:hypothetical protein
MSQEGTISWVAVFVMRLRWLTEWIWGFSFVLDAGWKNIPYCDSTGSPEIREGDQETFPEVGSGA